MNKEKKIIAAIKAWKEGGITTNLLLKLCEDSNYKITFCPNGVVKAWQVSP